MTRLFPKHRIQTTEALWLWADFIYVPVKPDEKSLLLIRGYFPSGRAACPVTPDAGSWTEMDAGGFFCLPEPISTPLNHFLSAHSSFDGFGIIDRSYNQGYFCFLTDDASQSFQTLRGGLLSQLIY